MRVKMACFDYPDPNYKPGVVNPRYDDPDFAGPPNIF